MADGAAAVTPVAEAEAEAVAEAGTGVLSDCAKRADAAVHAKESAAQEAVVAKPRAAEIVAAASRVVFAAIPLAT